MRLAVIVPVLNEADTVGAALARLQPLRERGASVIVVDGGSTDATAERARAGADCVLDAPRGRAVQMNRGAEVALRDGAVDALLFLHADTRLPDRADERSRPRAAAGRWRGDASTCALPERRRGCASSAR
jgi:glycosyltransferase involved in cell wall biosynthesis